MTETSSFVSMSCIDKSKLPDLQVMKKALLAQIDVTLDDLKVMSIEEITLFYNELMEGSEQKRAKLTNVNELSQAGTNFKDSVQENHIDNGNNQNIKQKIKQACIQKEKDIETEKEKQKEKGHQKTHKNNINQNGSIITIDKQSKKVQQKFPIYIKGKEYYKPKFLSQSTYHLANKRLAILCGPRLASTEQKRQILLTAYNSNVSNAVKALRPHQVQQTYERFRTPQKKQNLIIKLDKALQTKLFVIYLQRQPIQKGSIFYSARRQQKLNTTKSQILNQMKNDLNEIEPNEVYEDQFFDQYFEQSKLKELRQANKIDKFDKVKKKQNLLKSQLGLRQRIQFINKKKDKKQISTQTQTQKPKQRIKKLKSKIMIVKHIENLSDNNDQQIQNQIRDRPQNQIQILVGPRKLKNKQLRKQLLEPAGQSPSPQILQLIQNLKQLTTQFQNHYLNQFQN